MSYVERFPGQEIIVVCDGCDRSRELICHMAEMFPNIRILSFDRRLGKGGAIIEGFRAAKGEHIGFVAADESVFPKCVEKMFISLGDFDGIIASRRLKKSIILKKQPLKRRIASRGFNLFVKLFFGLPFRDTQCGAKVFKKQAIYAILDELKTSGFEIDVEILWRLKKKGYKVGEYPITWKHSTDSKFRLYNSGEMLSSLLKMYVFS